MKFGLLLPQGFLYGLPKNPIEARNKVVKIAKLAEELGFNSVWVVDHFIPYPFITSDNVFESWTLLSYIASVTTNIRLGTLVSCNLYRYPTLLAKMASTLDILSNGRLEFGIGACWYTEEFSRYGVSYFRFKRRIEMLDEALRIIKLAWTKDEVTFRGKYYNVKNLILEPKPKQKPHPPITIGGSSRTLLKIVAKHADKWNFVGSLNDLESKYNILVSEIKRIGRKHDISVNYLVWAILGNKTTHYILRFVKYFLHIMRTVNFKVAYGDLGFVRTNSFTLGTYGKFKKIVDYASRKGVDEMVVYLPILDEHVLSEFAKHIIEKF